MIEGGGGKLLVVTSIFLNLISPSTEPHDHVGALYSWDLGDLSGEMLHNSDSGKV
jgi:hypothetical protein